jgi:small subunit ribosomal protein S8
MTMTDPIADMLTRIRNANTAMHDSTSMPSSKLKESIADILSSEGYISSYRVVDADDKRPGKALEIELKYSPERRRTISGIKRVSKPGLRVYAKRDRLPRVLGGLGIAILSTSHGLLTDRQAARRGIGGEVLCYVW